MMAFLARIPRGALVPGGNDGYAADRHGYESTGRRSAREQISGSGTTRSKRQAWIKIEQPGVEIRRSCLIHTTGHRIGAVQFGDCGFVGSRVCLRQHRNLVPATGARGDVTVGKEFLSLVQAGLLVHPENLVTAAIRKINELRFADLDNPRVVIIETGIMFGDYWIVIGDFSQFFTGDDAARDHRVRIHSTSIPRLYCWRAEWRRQRVGSLNDDVVTRQLLPRFTQPAERQNATRHNRKKSDAAYKNAADSTPAPPPSAPTSRMPHCKSPNDTTTQVFGKGGAIQL